MRIGNSASTTELPHRFMNVDLRSFTAKLVVNFKLNVLHTILKNWMCKLGFERMILWLTGHRSSRYGPLCHQGVLPVFLSRCLTTMFSTNNSIISSPGFGLYSYLNTLLAGSAIIAMACLVYGATFIVPASACELQTTGAQQGLLVAAPVVGTFSF